METLIFFFFLLLLSSLDIVSVSGLICYECDNRESHHCGHHFKPYHFQPVNCGLQDVKCGIQRQPPNKDGEVGIIRGCYRLGQLQGINETNGCRNWENQEGFTALYCFCDTDFCNHGSCLSNMRNTFLLALITVELVLGAVGCGITSYS